MTFDFERIKPAIARVDAVGEETSEYGTAFYIGSRYLLTALHVVADTTVSPPAFRPILRLQFSFTPDPLGATVVQGFWSADGDWAVLECEVQPTAVPIELGSQPLQNSAWITYGFPRIHPDGMTISGTIRDANLRPLRGPPQSPQKPVLQLYCEDAAAGLGARLHGFSGSPCLVDGKAVGILRRTLIEEMVDGQFQPMVLTQAGTVFATPTSEVIAWQTERRKSVLPENWAPPELAMQDFIVLLSQSEPAASERARLSLRSVAETAYGHLRNSGLSRPYFASAADAVASEERLRQWVQVLCHAKVVVFDATEFEPAIMFLAGIRAVVRRGVTLLSVGGDYALGKKLAIPFNVTDANIVAHSAAQNRSSIGNSVTLLRQRIERGLDALRTSTYLDLPVYDVIRQLPVERRGIIPGSAGVLVLCPFDDKHTEFWQDKLKQALENELSKFRQGRSSGEPEDFGVARSFELNSPRLVTQAVYEAIRRAQACVVDLSQWSANVMFEFGVRLAASGERTACIIEKDWDSQPDLRPTWLPQCRSLAALFVGEGFRYALDQSWESQVVFSNAYGPDALPLASTLLEGKLHRWIEQTLDVESEPASRSIVLDLLDQAATFSRPPAGGRSKPVGLFPGNLELVRREEVAEFERLMTAWLFVWDRYSTEQILENASIREPVDEVIRKLFQRHIDRMSERSKSEAGAMRAQINRWKRQHDQSHPC